MPFTKAFEARIDLMRLLLKILHALLTLSPRDIAVLMIIFTSVTSWIIGIQMRRKIRKNLGRKATEENLTSIDTWMKVDKVEQQNKDA